MKKLFIDCQKEQIMAIKVNNGVMQDFFCVDRDNIVDNIYIGRVENVRGDNCFVNFDTKRKNGIIKLKTNKYKSGDYIRCQVQRDDFQEKGAILTEEITLAGKYVILAENIKGYKFSHRLEKNDIAKLRESLPYVKETGFIVRSNTLNANIDNIILEINDLIAVYNKLLIQGDRIQNIYKKPIIDLLISQTDSYDCDIIINSEEYLNSIKQNNITLYDRIEPIQEFYNLRAQVEELFARRIILKDGAEIVFDFTEAMTVIDVNSKSDFGDKRYINKMAAKEILRQIKLRNISGMIIIDFISQKNKLDELIDFINDELKKDKVRSRVLALEDYSIIAINRKKMYNAFIMQFYEECSQCSNGFAEKESLKCKNICFEILNLYKQSPFSHILVNIDEKLHREFVESARFYLHRLINETKIYIKKVISPTVYSIVITSDNNFINGADLLQEAE